MLKNHLQELGLSEKESTLYLALLELGTASVQHMAKQSGLNRSTCYIIIDSLLAKKLITTTITGKKTYYVAEPPEKLKLLLTKKMSLLKDILPELSSLTHAQRTKPVLRYLDGIEGIKEAYRKSLHAHDTFLVGFTGFDNLSKPSRALTEFWDKEYMPARKKYNKKGRLIVPDNDAGNAYRFYDDEQFRETRRVEAKFNFELDLFCYDNVLTLISYSKQEEFALLIESTAVANTFKMIWQIAWQAAY